jgi:ADP-ribosylglycohydrolase
MEKTLMLGGDTDTNCCIAGCLFGALYGEDEFMRAKKERMLEIADKTHRMYEFDTKATLDALK